MDGSLGESQHWSMDRTGDVRMLEYETYAEKKWLERHSIREDPIHLRETYRRIKDEQRRKHRSCKGARLSRLPSGAIARFQRHCWGVYYYDNNRERTEEGGCHTKWRRLLGYTSTRWRMFRLSNQSIAHYMSTGRCRDAVRDNLLRCHLFGTIGRRSNGLD